MISTSTCTAIKKKKNNSRLNVEIPLLDSVYCKNKQKLSLLYYQEKYFWVRERGT